MLNIKLPEPRVPHQTYIWALRHVLENRPQQTQVPERLGWMVTPHGSVVKVHLGPNPLHNCTPPPGSPSLPIYPPLWPPFIMAKVCRNRRVH